MRAPFTTRCGPLYRGPAEQCVGPLEARWGWGEEEEEEDASNEISGRKCIGMGGTLRRYRFMEKEQERCRLPEAVGVHERFDPSATDAANNRRPLG